MVTQTVLYNAALVSMAVFNLSLAGIFLFFRLRTGDINLTKAQKWTLTLLFWLFTLNGTHLFLDSHLNYLIAISDITRLYFETRVLYQIDLLIAGLLMAFGLVYPRPYTSWKKLYWYFYIILGVCILLIVLWIAFHNLVESPSGQFLQISGYLYVVGWFVPLFIWVPDYEKQTSTQGRMISTILIWGILAVPIGQAFVGLIPDIISDDGFNPLMVIMVLLSSLILFRIIRSLVRRWGHWSLAEWTHLIFMIIFSSLPFVNNYYLYLVYPDGNLPANSLDIIGFLLGLIVGPMTWAFLRPTLFAYGMLRYQLFGSQLKGESVITRLFSFSISFWVGSLVMLSTIDGVGLEGSIAIGALVGALVIIPVMKGIERVIHRLLPMSGGSEKASMVERRATYLIGLQTAVVNGRIDEPSDVLVIQKLQQLLSISQREHNLLMESHNLRAPPGTSDDEFTELFLIMTDGRLVAHYSPDPSLEQQKEVMAGMLIAIRGFVEEGFKSEQSELDSIRYGDFSLGIETDNALVLAALKKGNMTSEDRQRLRDHISTIWEKYHEKLKDWDGDLGSLQGIDGLLGTLASGAKKV